LTCPLFLSSLSLAISSLVLLSSRETLQTLLYFFKDLFRLYRSSKGTSNNDNGAPKTDSEIILSVYFSHGQALTTNLVSLLCTDPTTSSPASPGGPTSRQALPSDCVKEFTDLTLLLFQINHEQTGRFFYQSFTLFPKLNPELFQLFLSSLNVSGASTSASTSHVDVEDIYENIYEFSIICSRQ